MIIKSNLVFSTALFFITSLSFGQEEKLLMNFGILMDGNIGVQYSGNFDFKSSNPEGQKLLGVVGRDGETNEVGLMTGELGFETTLILKSGLLFKGDFHSAKTLYSGVNRHDEWEVEGVWRGRGMSLGVGYGEISDDAKPFYFATTISLGLHQSEWEFTNRDSDEPINFGSVNIPYESSEKFISNNFYLDLNLKGGPCKFFNKKNKNSSFNPAISFGYRQSLHRSFWVWTDTNETVQNINSTLMMGFYVKFSLGFAYFHK